MKALIVGLFDNGEDENNLQNIHTSLFAQLDAKVDGKLSDHLNL